jgi:hypothetical protein
VFTARLGRCCHGEIGKGAYVYAGALPIFRQIKATCGGSRLAARSGPELPEDGRDVMVDRAFGEDKPFGNLAVRKAFRDKAEHLELP